MNRDHSLGGLGERRDATRAGIVAFGNRPAVFEGLLPGFRQRHDRIGAEADIDRVAVDPQSLAPCLGETARGRRLHEQ